MYSLIFGAVVIFGMLVVLGATVGAAFAAMKFGFVTAFGLF